jgi:Tol biopolymer transport system component
MKVLCSGVLGSLLLFTVPARVPDTLQLTFTEGTNFAVAVSPQGTRLVMDLQGTLWLLPAEGGEARPLTDGLGDDRLPDWSPDGKRIAFQSFRRGSWDIWVLGEDGAGLVALTSGREDDREPVWSPDGKRMAFSSDRSGNYDLWLLDVSTGETTALTRDPADDFMPAWSPDGRALVFLSRRGEGGGLELWRTRLADRKEERLAALSGQAASPGFSPDGSRLVFTLLSERSFSLLTWRFPEAHTSDLVSIPAAGGDPTPLTAGQDVFPFRPSWSRQGELFYTADGKIRALAPQTGESRVLPFSATVGLNRPAYPRRKVKFSPAEGVLPARGIVRPVLSPDGSRIAFAALGDLWVAEVDSDELRPLTRDFFLEADPCWSPDGTEIVFASDRAGTMDLWIVRADASLDGQARQLTRGKGAEAGPAWSPDGRQIAFLDEEANVHVVEAAGGEPRLLRKTVGGAGIPSWSSDSEHLAIAVRKSHSERFREGDNRMVVLSARDGSEVALEEPASSFGTRDGDGPVWSPDGRSLAFAMDGGLWILPVTPSGIGAGSARQVVDEPVDFPSWSGDSRSLLFVASDKLKMVDVETGAVREVSARPGYRLPSESGRLVVKGVRLIDGTGAPARENVDIWIEASRIKRIEPTGDTHPADARVIEASGKTVIPGLIEMHAHLSLPAWGSRHGRIFLSYGVTSVRIPAMSVQRILEEREAIQAGSRVGPRIFPTGYILDGDRIYYSGSLALDTEEELRRELGRAFRLDYDLLKTYVRLPDALQKTAIEEAHRQGVFVTSHELYPAVALGVDGIEHLRGTSRRGFSPKLTELRRSYRDVVDLVSRSGVYFTPTLAIQGGFRLALAREPKLLDDPRLASLFPAWALEASRRAPGGEVSEREEVVRPLFATVSAIARDGGRIVAGTDSPIMPYGLGLILEIELYSEAGMGPLGAIRSATQVAAEALGAADDLGTLEPGKLADLVVLNGNPLEDIRNLRLTDRVIVGGREISVERLMKLPEAIPQ